MSPFGIWKLNVCLLVIIIIAAVMSNIWKRRKGWSTCVLDRAHKNVYDLKILHLRRSLADRVGAVNMV